MWTRIGALATEINFKNLKFTLNVFSDVFVLAGISLLSQIFGILTLLHSMLTLLILKMHIPTPNEVFRAIVH